MLVEIVLLWAAVFLYALGAVLYVVGLIFRKELPTRAALWASLAGVVPQAVAFGVRWSQVGHPPYLGYFEVLSLFAFLSVLVFGGLTLRYRPMAVAGIFVMPMAFLLSGAALFMPSAAIPITPRLASLWLDIHVIFASLSFSFLLVSFALALVYLTRERSPSGRWASLFERLPDQSVVDDLSYRFVLAGTVFLAIMIASGAIWANQAWGRYWGWDPVETWCLISFLVYSLALHLRLVRGWRGKRWAWVTLAALPFLVFAVLLLPLVYHSIHNGDLLGR
jgi:cytochrome c-type biogenesis protein CcsB